MNAAGTTPQILWTVFDTAFGPMGAAAGRSGLVRVLLPCLTTEQLAESLNREFPAACRNDEHFAEFAELARAYFLGRRVDFSQIRCDLPSKTTFRGRVYRACREIAFGRRCSYGELARLAGNSKAARAAASAMKANRLPLVVPCHRIIRSDGTTGGFSAGGGVELKKRMLELEAKAASS